MVGGSLERRKVSAASCATLLLMSLMGTVPRVAHSATDAHAADFDSRCRALEGLKFSASTITLQTSGARIDSAGVSQASDVNGVYCKVQGQIEPVDRSAPPIRFAINLPETWNKKAIHLGGGGYNGQIVDGLHAAFLGADGGHLVGRGFVTFGSDSGHHTDGPPRSAEFALNDEAAANFGGAQLKKVHDVALQLVTTFYHSPPRRLYFYGNSQGGHEGLTVAQRWPLDYSGVVAIHPAYDFAALQLSGIHLGQSLYRTPESWLSPAAVALIAKAVLTACDSLDGIEDGIISNVPRCRSTFHVESLRCPDGQPVTDKCLSGDQLQAVRAFDEPLKLGLSASGVTEFSRWPLLEGAFTESSPMGFFGLGSRSVPGVPPTPADAFVYVMGDQFIRYIVLKDPGYDSFQFQPRAHVDRLMEVSKSMDASDPNLDAFEKHGGKLILLHGTVDMAIPPENTVAYYDQLQHRYSKRSLRGFVRFYMVPGFGHGDGAFQMSWDAVSMLDAWVDKGQAPDKPVAIDTAKATAGRSRPLCEYPSWPRYAGQGDPNQAASFACTAPQ